MLNWEMELKRWCPSFKILTYYGSQKERRLKRQVSGWGGDPEVTQEAYTLVCASRVAFICSYSLLFFVNASIILFENLLFCP